MPGFRSVGCRHFRPKTAKKSALVCLFLWIACWFLVNMSVFIHKSIFAEYCTDQKSKRILGKLVVAIDVDMAFFEPKMRDILEQNCTNDEDCNFFDCFSQCNLKTKRCRAERSNNNLQVICDKIFRPLFSPQLSELRVYHPLQSQLYKAVERCAELSSHGSVNKKTMEGTFFELYNLFKAGQKEQ